MLYALCRKVLCSIEIDQKTGDAASFEHVVMYWHGDEKSFKQHLLDHIEYTRTLTEGSQMVYVPEKIWGGFDAVTSQGEIKAYIAKHGRMDAKSLRVRHPVSSLFSKLWGGIKSFFSSIVGKLTNLSASSIAKAIFTMATAFLETILSKEKEIAKAGLFILRFGFDDDFFAA